MNVQPLIVVPARQIAVGDRMPAYDGFGSTAWLEVAGVQELGPEQLEVQFGPGASHFLRPDDLVSVARSAS